MAPSYIDSFHQRDSSDDIHEPPLDTEAERPRGFGELQPHHMPGGKVHVPPARVVSDFSLLLSYYYRHRRKQGYPTLHHHKVAKRT